MSQLTQDYSGIVLNQNQAPLSSSEKVVFSAQQWYQEFYLPANYVRGTGDEQVIPPLTGFHLLTEVASGRENLVGFDWTIDHYLLGTGWVTAAYGTILRAPASGSKVWVEGLLDDPLEIPSAWVDDKFRISITTYGNVSTVSDFPIDYDEAAHTLTYNGVVLSNIFLTPGVPVSVNFVGLNAYVYQESPGDPVLYTETECPTSIWYSAPNPFALQGSAARYGASYLPVVNGASQQVSFLFRVVGLTADEGTDFLGNTYRSAIHVRKSDNVTTAASAEDAIWMSKPNPSRFAVENLYFDVRANSPTTYPVMNIIKNPSGEVSAANWVESNAGASATIDTTWAVSGSQSIRTTGSTAAGTTYPGLKTPTGTSGMKVQASKTYSAMATFKITTMPASATQGQIFIRYYDSAGTFLGTTYDSFLGSFTPAVGIFADSATFTTPANAVYASVHAIMQTTTNGQAFDFSIDQVLLVQGSLPTAYFDGDTDGYEWVGAPGLSESVKVVSPQITDSAVVIDSILVDPITPGVFFNVYYSNEGDSSLFDNLTEQAWERKLWTKIPGTFQANRRETHVFKKPITAKYVKVEFSHLQAKPYFPGDLVRKTSYKKHPKWVLEYFMARVDARNALEARLMNKTVGIVFDSYDLAYNYYLDDLGQEPERPIDAVPNTSILSNFLKENSFVDQVDPLAASKILTEFAPYTTNISTWFGDSLLGQVAASTTNFDSNSSESYDGGRIDVLEVRDTEVAYEQDFPVMFFFVTCRHKYREVVAEFTHDRAYFVGIRQISFNREHYAVQYDSDQYVEPAGDLTNIERNDFNVVDGIMVAS